MELAVFKISGDKTTKKVKLDDAIFGIKPNDHAIWLDVKQHLANARQGTSQTKERGEIVGSRRKIKRQKGTGTARFGDIKNPLFRGGGRIFGPKPRDYYFKMNKKVKKLARKSALTYKAQDNGITIIEDFTFEAPRTKDYISFLNSLNLEDKKTLVVLSETDKNVVLSARNLKNTKIARADSLNTYDILNANTLVISESSVKVIEENLG